MAANQSDLPDLSPAQSEIMEIVWERGEVTANEVRRVLSRSRRLRATTVRTLLERMEDKGGCGIAPKAERFSMRRPGRATTRSGRRSARSWRRSAADRRKRWSPPCSTTAGCVPMS